MAKTKAAEAVATGGKSALSVVEDMKNVPDHLRVDKGRGSENVTAQDLTIPRLGIIQGVSPQIDPDSPKFIPGATLGQMFNSLTGELYDSVLLTDIFYRKEFGVFVKRTSGGGFRGSYTTEEEAITAVETMEDKSTLEIIETGVHFCLMLDSDDETGTMKAVGEIVLFMTSTKLKISRNLNSLIRQRGPNADRWAGVWLLTTSKESNKKGTFYNFLISPSGWISAAINQICSEIYKLVVEGRRKIDREIDPEEEGEPANAKM